MTTTLEGEGWSGWIAVSQPEFGYQYASGYCLGRDEKFINNINICVMIGFLRKKRQESSLFFQGICWKEKRNFVVSSQTMCSYYCHPVCKCVEKRVHKTYPGNVEQIPLFLSLKWQNPSVRYEKLDESLG